MSERLTDEQIAMFRRRLILAEKSCGTIEKYLRDVRKLQHFLAGAPLSKQNILHFKGLCQGALCPHNRQFDPDGSKQSAFISEISTPAGEKSASG